LAAGVALRPAVLRRRLQQFPHRCHGIHLARCGAESSRLPAQPARSASPTPTNRAIRRRGDLPQGAPADRMEPHDSRAFMAWEGRGAGTPRPLFCRRVSRPMRHSAAGRPFNPP
jgi:hypothetical protein